MIVLNKKKQKNKAQSLVEYVIILAYVSVVIVTVFNSYSAQFKMVLNSLVIKLAQVNQVAQQG